MHRDLKFKILSESMTNGVSMTCKKYSISRTIYYRWLKRYKAEGIDGLDRVKRDFIPANKTSDEIERTVMGLIKIYPSYGPKALGYLLEELGHKISSSAVFNILKRHNLTNKYARIKYAGKNPPKASVQLPPLEQLQSGEGWIFWVTDFGSPSNHKNLYAYTLMDLKSRIGCTRLYRDIAIQNVEDLLGSVALSVAATLDLKSSYLCFFKEDKIILRYGKSYGKGILETLRMHGKEMNLLLLEKHSDYQTIHAIKDEFNGKICSAILPLIRNEEDFSSVKHAIREFVKKYNLNDKIQYETDFCTPVDYHNKMTNTKLILPLWAYMDREY